MVVQVETPVTVVTRFLLGRPVARAVMVGVQVRVPELESVEMLVLVAMVDLLTHPHRQVQVAAAVTVAKAVKPVVRVVLVATVG